MFALITTAVEFLNALILLFPESFQNLMMARVDAKWRPDPNRLEMRVVPTVATFAFGFAMFSGWDQILNRPAQHISDPFQAKIAIGGCAILLAFALWGCLWPTSFMERFAYGLSGKIATLESRSSPKIVLVGKGVGIASLLALVFIRRRLY